MTAYRFLEPQDVLFLRGNKLFGDPGSYGESMVPPWPSAAAGAIRSWMLAEEQVSLSEFAAGRHAHPTLGTPASPGSFTLAGFHLARSAGNGIETFHPLPADLIASRSETGDLVLQRLRPGSLMTGTDSSFPLTQIPLLAADRRAKPVSGVWITQEGWQAYLNGELPGAAQLLESGTLWCVDTRIGIGLDAEQRSAEEGKLFTIQAVVLAQGYGFLAAIDGATPPADGCLRLGGDGRAAAVSTVDYQPPEPEYEAIAKAGRCRIVLTSPGIFPDGWRLPGTDAESHFSLGGVTGKLVCAALARAGTVSGWDLAHWRPKPAQRAAPTGSIYWIDALGATPDELRKLAKTGLWPDAGDDPQRRAEGFNRFTFASY